MTSPADDQSPEANGAGSKRKSEDASGQPRAKRNRYISIACNECKRRKIKCNGQAPCQRCGNLALECVYAPNCCAASFKESDEYRRMSQQIGSLQQQVETLFASLNGLRAELASSASNSRIDPSLQRQSIDPSLQHHSLAPPRSSLSGPQQSHSRPRQPLFVGPTSSHFSLGVAKNSLQSMGIAPQEDGQASANTTDVTPTGSPSSDAQLHPSKDPIWHVSREEAVRLVNVYEDEMHEMYPVVEIPHIQNHLRSLYTYMEAAVRNGFVQTRMPGSDSIDDQDTNILKLILSTAMVLEGSGKSELGRSMFAYVQPSVDALLLGHAGFKGIRMLALAAMHEFHCDNEARSWRVIGLTVRLCIELGLHRKETYDALPEDERASAVLLFWAIYCLDRRWSFGTGMPFALQDSDIDANLPKPNDQSPYLTSMIAHFNISSKIWHAIGNDASKSTISKEEIGYLDFQILNWHRQLPDHLRYDRSSPSSTLTSTTTTPGQHRLQIILYLRTNAMRILLHRHVLHSSASIINNRPQAATVVDVAKDTIRLLTLVNQTSDLYRTSQVLFNAFLTSALAVLFLAVSHAPHAFADLVREEFHLALDLVRGFSRDSWVGRRLWKTIRVLKDVGPKLGLVAKARRPSSSTVHLGTGVNDTGVGGTPSGTTTPAFDPQGGFQRHVVSHDHRDASHSAAAVAMTTLAGHSVDETALFGGPSSSSWAMGGGVNGAGLAASGPSPDGMVHDLTDLFEAVGGYGHVLGFPMNGGGLGDGVMGGVGGGVGGGSPGLQMSGFGNEDELSRIMRDLF